MSQTCPQTGQTYLDLDWNQFVAKLFAQPPQDPFTFYMELLTEVNEQQLSQMLGLMLVSGAKTLYQKEIAELSPDEIEILQKYYRSLGFEVEYQIEQQMKYSVEHDREVPFNLFKIDFKPCSQLLNQNNIPRYE